MSTFRKYDKLNSEKYDSRKSRLWILSALAVCDLTGNSYFSYLSD